MPQTIMVKESTPLPVVTRAYDQFCVTEWKRGEGEEEGTLLGVLLDPAGSSGAYFSLATASPYLGSPAQQMALPTEPPMADWFEFQQFVAAWKHERGARSSITQRVACPAYLSIIALGKEKAVPFIMAQMRSEGEEPDQWFVALKVLTGVDPVEPEDRGNYRKMAQSWLRWFDTLEHAWNVATL